MCLLDAEDGRERLAIPDAALQFVRGLSFSVDGRRIAAGGSGATRVWETTTGAAVSTATKLPDGMCPSFLPGGVLVGWNHGEGRVYLCDPSWRTPMSWPVDPTHVNGLADSSDGRFCATIGDDGRARVWSVANPVEVATPVGHDGAAFAVAFSPDGTRLATGGRDDRCVHLRDLSPVCQTRR